MQKYKPVEVSERRLEELIRQGSDLIEDGLQFIDHQRMTDRGPLDVLMVDSGRTLVLAELKAVEDDTMLVQGIDYYDYVSRNIEGIARVYKKFGVDPCQPVRLFLIAPSFSVSLLNRCRWIDIPLSLFTYRCIQLDGSAEIVPVFSEVTIPATPELVEAYTLETHLQYITDEAARKRLEALLQEIRGWDPREIAIEPIKYWLSLKVGGRVFSYIGPRRKHFVVGTYDNEEKWSQIAVRNDDDLETVNPLLQRSVERFRS